MAIETPSRPVITLRPDREALEEPLREHHTKVRELLVTRSEAMDLYVRELVEARPLEGEPPAEAARTAALPMIARPIALDGKMAMRPIVEQARREFLDSLGGSLTTCATQLFYPPYLAATPDDVERVTDSSYGYPLQTQQAHAENGRIEVGVIASRQYGERNFWNINVSDAIGSVSIMGPVAPNGYTGQTVSFGAIAYVDAFAQGWAYEGKFALAALSLDLDVTVLEAGPSGYVSHEYSASKLAYSKYQQGGGAFSDPISGSHVLTLGTTVTKPGAAIFFATLSARAEAYSSRVTDIGGWQCPLAIVDAEGFDTPKGDYYLKAGSVSVLGFSVSACPE